MRSFTVTRHSSISVSEFEVSINALNKDHNTISRMPDHMAELGSDNFDQELTLSLLGEREGRS